VRRAPVVRLAHNQETPAEAESDAASFPRQKAAKSAELVRYAMAGNFAITSLKLAASGASGSSALFAEAIHSGVDTMNQALLLIGLRDAGSAPDKRHPYGYGRSVYVWSLISAVGTFWLGAGVSFTNSVFHWHQPTMVLEDVTWHLWGVLGFSFLVDGAVLMMSLRHVLESLPPDKSISEHVMSLRDPTTVAVLLEDSAACAGVLIAGAGIGLSQLTGHTHYDVLGEFMISGLLGAMGIALVRLNVRSLIGRAVDPQITGAIKALLLSRPSIDAVHSVTHQWEGPYTFSYKAELDFDGTYIAARLHSRYLTEFQNAQDLDKDLKILLAWYAEDVVRVVEREVNLLEAKIREEYPEAAFIELVPDSTDTSAFAIEGNKQQALRRVEQETINQYLAQLSKEKEP